MDIQKKFLENKYSVLLLLLALIHVTMFFIEREFIRIEINRLKAIIAALRLK